MAKLNQRQWDKIEKRLLAGEKITVIARDNGISHQAIRKRLGSLVTEIKQVANQIVETETALRKLPDVAQVTARNLADDLMAISMHAASGSKYGAMTFHRLTGIANQHAQTLDDNDPSPETLTLIGALTKVGNDAVAPALNLLAANKDRIKEADDLADAEGKLIQKIELVALE
jgi:hypothetical protein